MIPSALLQQVLSGRAEPESHKDKNQIILFANRGTTFVGGQDDIHELTETVAEIEVVPSYSHVNDPFDLRFVADGLRLEPPGTQRPNSRIPVVQGSFELPVPIDMATRQSMYQSWQRGKDRDTRAMTD
jgi:hypothetical protein